MSTEAQLKAISNSELASGNQIPALKHRTVNNAIIEEMYDAQSRGDVLAGVQSAVSIASGDQVLVIRSGQAYLLDSSEFGFVDALADLTDVSIPTPANDQVLAYNTATSKWVAKDVNTLTSVVSISGTATTNALTKFTGTSSIGNSNIVDDGSTIAITGNLAVNTDDLYINSTNGRVGIGTASPATNFQVSGNILADFVSTTGNSYTKIFSMDQDIQTTDSVEFLNVTAGSFITSGGTSNDFVKGDGSLDSTDYQGQIDAEEAARISADNTLQANIDSEASTRAVADTTLQSNIDAEEAARISADADLQSQIDSNDTDISNLQSSKQDISEKGQANGYAPLDSGAKVAEAYLPDSILGQVSYQGTWDASTNTPTLANPPASTTKGEYYVTSVAGTQFSIDFQVGDWIISNGTSWEKVDNTDAVTSVFGRLGNIVANESDYSSFYPLVGTTISAGSGLTGGGDLSANRTISHADTSSQSSVDNSGGAVIQDIALDPFGHVTALGSVNLDSRYYTETEVNSLLSGKEDVFSKNTAFNKNFGTSAGTVAEGNHTHDAGAIVSGTFANARISSSSVQQHVTKAYVDGLNVDADTLDGNDSSFFYPASNPNGYISSYTETDTLDSVTDRGATTTNAITVGGATINGNLTVDTNTLFVDATNNRVGIGTSSPDGIKLDVRGVIQSKGADSLIRIGELSSTSTYLQSISSDFTTSRDFVFFNTSERMRIDSSGNVSIGTTMSLGTFTVNGGTTTVAGASNVSTGLSDFTNSTLYVSHPSGNGNTVLLVGSAQIGFATTDNTTTTERVRITSSGNVGIGTSNPNAKLEVVGDIKASGDVILGGTISTNSGTNEWDLRGSQSDIGLTVSTTNYIWVTIDGVDYALALVSNAIFPS